MHRMNSRWGRSSFIKAEDGRSAIRVRLQDDTVWMTQNLMAELYQTTQQNISLHVRDIFEGNELREASVVMEAASPAAGATAGAACATGAAGHSRGGLVERFWISFCVTQSCQFWPVPARSAMTRQ